MYREKVRGREKKEKVLESESLPNGRSRLDDNQRDTSPPRRDDRKTWSSGKRRGPFEIHGRIGRNRTGAAYSFGIIGETSSLAIRTLVLYQLLLLLAVRVTPGWSMWRHRFINRRDIHIHTNPASSPLSREICPFGRTRPRLPNFGRLLRLG